MQNEYINREALKKGIECHYKPTDQEYESDREWAIGYNAGLERALYTIAYAPAADVVEVVHAKAVLDDEEMFLVCSNCGYPEPLNYCKQCGAKIDGERREDSNEKL